VLITGQHFAKEINAYCLNTPSPILMSFEILHSTIIIYK